MATESGSTDFRYRPTVSAVASRRMVDAAVAEANAMAVPVTVVVMDEPG